MCYGQEHTLRIRGAAVFDYISRRSVTVDNVISSLCWPTHLRLGHSSCMKMVEMYRIGIRITAFTGPCSNCPCLYRLYDILIKIGNFVCSAWIWRPRLGRPGWSFMKVIARKSIMATIQSTDWCQVIAYNNVWQTDKQMDGQRCILNPV